MTVGTKPVLPWLRKPAVFVSCVVTVLFLSVALEPYDPADDPHGEGALLRVICIRALHLILGVGLFLGSVFGNIRPLFGILVLTAPLAHLAACPTEGPLF